MLHSTKSAVLTEAQRAPGGEIRVSAHHLVHLQQSRITTTVAGGDQRAGNITIDPEFVVLQDSTITANAVGGRGGNVTVRAQVFLADPASRVTASSEENIDGEIHIQAPVTNLSGVVPPLPQDVVPAAALLRDQCAARLREGTVSSLVMRERDGIPATPEGFLPSHRYGADADPSHTPPNGQLPAGAPTTSWRGGLQVDATGRPRITNWPAARDTTSTRSFPCPR
jgi:hypothetical protein